MMMLRPRGGNPGGFKVNHNFAQVVARLNLAKTKLPVARQQALDAIGVRVLAWAYRDYRAKSNGETRQGVKWRGITDGALRSRLAKRSPWKRTGDQLARLRADEAPIVQAMRHVMRRDSAGGTSAIRAAAMFAWLKNHHKEEAALRRIKTNRAKAKASRKSMIAKERAGAKIGVDTGRLVNGLKFGERNNVHLVTRTSVTVGAFARDQKTGFDYSEAFDAGRPIFGPQFIDGARRQELERIMLRVYEKAIKDAL